MIWHCQKICLFFGKIKCLIKFIKVRYKKFDLQMHMFTPLLPCLCRYEDTGDSAPRYSAYVRQCPPAVLFCVLYIRHCWGAALGWSSEEQVFPGQQCEGVSAFIFCSVLGFFPVLSLSLQECVRVSDVIQSDSQLLPSAVTFQMFTVL